MNTAKALLPLVMVSPLIISTSFAAGPGGAVNADPRGVTAGIGRTSAMPDPSPANTGLGISTALSAPIAVSAPPASLPTQAAEQALINLPDVSQTALPNAPNVPNVPNVANVPNLAPASTPNNDHGALVSGMARDLAASARAAAGTGGLDFKDVIRQDAAALSDVARQNSTNPPPTADILGTAAVPVGATLPTTDPLLVPASSGTSDEAHDLAEIAKTLPKNKDASSDQGSAARSLAEEAKRLFSPEAD